MFIIQLKYKASMQEVDKYLAAHREFLEYYYKQGILIASGPMKPRTGGIIIALASSLAEVESVFAKDPFCLADIAEYTFTEFTPVKHCNELKALVLKTEGKLC